MAVLTSTGEVVPRNLVYATPKKQRKQKYRNLLRHKSRRTISEKQAEMIIDMQIARKLRKMF